MSTPLYTTDVQKITDRTAKTTLTDTDVLVVANSSGTLAPITKVNTKETLGINANATAITTLNGDVSTAGSVLKVVKDNAKDATFTPTGTIVATDIKGAIAEVSLDVDKLNDTVAVEGSVLKSIKDNAQNATYDPATSGLTATTVKTAIDELADEKAEQTDLETLETTVDTNRIYSDSQYLALKAKADALQVKCNTLQAEVYTDDPILQYGAVEIIGKGYEADNTPIDVSANVVDGSLELEQKGLTITNLVDGANIANLGTVTFSTILNDKYYDTLNNAILTGTGSDMTATNNSGATANMGIYHLNALGLASITDTAILANLLPYVDGTQNVGKMGMRVVGENLFDNFENISFGTVSSSTRNYPLDAWRIISTDPTVNLVEKTLVFTGTTVNIIGTRRRLIPNIPYTVSIKTTGAESGLALFVNGVSDGNMVRTNNVFSITFTPTTSDTDIMIRVASSSDGTKSYMLPMLNLGSTALPYEPYQEQLTFLPAIGNSLPNGTADSIKTVADGWEHAKRVSTPASVGSGVAVNTTNYPTAKDGGQWVNELTAGGTEIGVVGTDSTTGAGMLRFELATPIVTKYDLPHLTSGRTIHRFAGEEKIALYGTGLTFSENVLTVLSAVKFVSGEMTDITSLATITDDTVTFSGVNATDVVYVKVEHDVDRPLGILEHTPTVSNTASRLKAIEDWIALQS